ncbi:HD-GYP domain-containing protein [Comamonas flocculans]|nr:HD domain-containing phosphohydrolase [Comamonas flocculans]
MPESVLINIEMLRVGMYVQLDVGWMNHPFATSSFRLSSPAQIQVLRELGLKQVRYVPSRSDPQALEALEAPDAGARQPPQTPASAEPPQPSEPAAEPVQAQGDPAPEHAAATDGPPSVGPSTWQIGGPADTPAPAEAQDDEPPQAHARARFQAAAELYAQVLANVRAEPAASGERVRALVRGEVAELMAAENYAVHLLAQMGGRRQVKHSVNVMVLSMLLGRSLGLGAAQLCHLATAGLLHDIGKLELPAHIAEPAAALSGPERQLYEEHVQRSVDLAQRMGLQPCVVRAIGEHHEMVDGSGFPARLQGAQISLHGQILALVNRYDRLCNPLHGERAHTPHEALARLFAQERKRFDATSVLAAFIRLLGVYPPGSIVQLDDGRFARVVSSNSLSPLRPSVLAFASGVTQQEARVTDLGQSEHGGIRRSVKFDALSDEALEFFMPAQQMCYFFARMPRPAKKAHAGRAG